MALFSKKQNTEAKKPVSQGDTLGNSKGVTFKSPRSLAHVLANPRITEKATDLQSMSNAYVFDISSSGTKTEIAQAIRQMYKVSPVKVRVVTVKPKVKRSMRTGRTGVRSGGRKAYVFLKKGDSISLS